MASISQFCLYIPGIMVFLVGSGRVRQSVRMNIFGMCVAACIINCSHIVKKDKKGREIYNYYNVLVEYSNPRTGHKERHALKSPTEYRKGQQVKVSIGKGTGEPVLAGPEEELLFHPWVTMVGGALLILLALFENQGNRVMGMACLSAVLAGAGASMIVNYVSLKRQGLAEIDAEIIDIYARQISKGTKIVKGNKFTYYPIVKYTLDGKACIRRCNLNSGRKEEFQAGRRIKLYYSPKQQAIKEKSAKAGILLCGIALLAIGILAGGSAASVAILHRAW